MIDHKTGSQEEWLGHVFVARPRTVGPQRDGIWWRRHDEYEEG